MLMRHLYLFCGMTALLLCNPGHTASEAEKMPVDPLRELCAKIVSDIDRKIEQKVTACIPAASVKNGDADTLMVVSRARFDTEQMRTTWVALAIVVAAQAINKVSASADPHLKAVMIDQANPERKSDDDWTLCSVSTAEAANLLSRVQAGEFKNLGAVYEGSSCAPKQTGKQIEKTSTGVAK